jgi:hypothetical protein
MASAKLQLRAYASKKRSEVILIHLIWLVHELILLVVRHLSRHFREIFGTVFNKSMVCNLY